MRIEILWQGEACEASELADGVITVGGDEGDAIRVPGLMGGLLVLMVDGSVLSVVSKQIAFIGATRFPPHVARLVLEGDSVVVDQLELRRPAVTPEHRQRVDTALVIKGLLRGDPFALSHSRAATLTCVTGVDLGTIYPLAFTHTILGRADEVDVRLHDRSVSRQHARLTRRGASATIEPCCPTNGLFLNGRQVRGAKRLKTGDVLELGQTVLRFDGPEQVFEEVTQLVGPEVSASPVPPGPTLELSGAESRAASREPLRLESWLVAVGVVLTVVGLLVVLRVAV